MWHPSSGVMTAASSSNGFYNFPIGGSPRQAPAPSWVTPRDAPRNAVAAQCSMILLTATLFATSTFASLYGEFPYLIPGHRAVRIEGGPFAGLLTNHQAAFIAAATAALGRRGDAGRRLSLWGARPGSIC